MEDRGLTHDAFFAEGPVLVSGHFQIRPGARSAMRCLTGCLGGYTLDRLWV